MSKRATWATRLGFILAAVGSAVGLGNVWRFPFQASQQGGAGFVLIYLIFILAIGLPAMLVEFVVGRSGRKNPVNAFESIGKPRWKFVGGLGVITAFVILAYYSVVGGWVLRYAISSITEGYFVEAGTFFETISVGWDSLLFHLIFMGVVAGIIALGVRDGIEKSVKIMVPAIIGLLVALAIYAFFLEGAMEGYSFYLSPDWGHIATNWPQILSAAAGQAFFTLSLGMGVMLTYSSYLKKRRNLGRDAGSIVGLDTFIAILTGFVVFPILLTIVGAPGEIGGPEALFITVGNALAGITGGRIIGFFFFFTVFIAAVSSAISILEVPVSYAVDNYDISRKKISLIVAGSIFLLGIPVAFQGLPMLAVYDGLVSQIFLPLGMFLLVLFVGWFYDGAADELSQGIESRKIVKFWKWYVRIPILIVIGFVLILNLFEYFGAPLL